MGHLLLSSLVFSLSLHCISIFNFLNKVRQKKKKEFNDINLVIHSLRSVDESLEKQAVDSESGGVARENSRVELEVFHTHL